MEIGFIKEIITAFKEAELTKLSLKCEDFELKLGKEDKMAQNRSSIVNEEITNPMRAESAIMMNSEKVNVTSKEAANTPLEEKSTKVIKSPMVGTFYSAGAPGDAPFVTVGTKVKKGDVVCVIEAMKLMNEVEAEEDGEIVEILIDNEEMVEYGEVLFVLR